MPHQKNNDSWVTSPNKHPECFQRRWLPRPLLVHPPVLLLKRPAELLALELRLLCFISLFTYRFKKKCQVVGHGEFWTNCMSIQYVSVSKVRKKTMSLHMFFIESLPQKHSCHYHPFLVFQWNICIHLIHLFFSCRKFMTTHTVEELKGFHCFQAV